MNAHESEVRYTLILGISTRGVVDFWGCYSAIVEISARARKLSALAQARYVGDRIPIESL